MQTPHRASTLRAGARPVRLFSSMIAACLLAGLAACLSPDAASAEAGVRKGTVNTAILNVRARPGTRYEVVAKLAKGAAVEVVGEQDGWYEIRPPADAEAWVAARYLDAQGTVTAADVYVRSGPGAIFSAFGKLDVGQTVLPVGTPVEDWQRIKAPPAATVWVNVEFVALDSPPAPPPPPPPPPPKPVAESARPAALPPSPAPRPSPESAESARPPSAPPSAPALSPPPTVGKAPPPKPPIRVDERYIEYLDQPSPDVFAFVPPLEERTPPGGAGVATEKSASLTGVVIPLKDRRTAFATHVLVRLDGRKAIPLCYLRTRLFPLDEWNYHDVRVYGRQIDYPGWQRPVLELNGIQLTNPE